jgi:hypothetical protein
MFLAELAVKANLHEDTYLAMMRAALRHRGDKLRLAQRGDVSQPFISYVTSRTHASNLSPRTAARLAPALFENPEVRASFVEHATLRKESRLRFASDLHAMRRECSPPELAALPETDFRLAVSGTDPRAVARAYRAVRETCMDLLRTLRPSRSPREFVELCLALCNVQCVLDRPDEALFYGKLARQILESLEPVDFGRSREAFGRLWIDAIRAEALAYHNLDLDQQAFDTNEAAIVALAVVKEMPAVGEIHVYVDQIRALSNTPGFGIRTVRRVARYAEEACERLHDDRQYRIERFFIRRAVASAYTQYGTPREAGPILQSLCDDTATLSIIGLVPQAGLLQSFAHQRFAVGDNVGGMQMLRRALQLSLDAGLTHQIRQNRELFGHVVDAILAELPITEVVMY